MPELDDRDRLQMAYNGLCGVIGNLEQVSEENRPRAIVTHAKTVLEALATLAHPGSIDGPIDPATIIRHLGRPEHNDGSTDA